MQVHIWPRRMRVVDAAKAAISDHASWVASSLGRGVVWKWSYTQIDSHGPASACAASPLMVDQWSAGSMPTRSKRQPCGTNMPNLMLFSLRALRRVNVLRRLSSLSLSKGARFDKLSGGSLSGRDAQRA